MKTNRLAKKIAYIGAGAGLVGFLIFGFLHGLYIGGIIGLKLSGMVPGGFTGPTTLSVVIVSLFMFIGVVISGLVFVAGSSVIGWITGYAFGWMLEQRGPKEEIETNAH